MPFIHIGSDHAGFELKNLLADSLKKAGYTVDDCGTDSTASCDYPLYARAVCDKVLKDNSTGILVCGTGIGMSMAANRFAGIRAALCGTELQACLAKRHNNANILCLGARITGSELALAITRAFLESSFEGGRHLRRVSIFDSLGQS